MSRPDEFLNMADTLIRKPWITFRPEVTMGSLFTIVAWIVFGVIAWTRIGDRLDYMEDAERATRNEQAEIVKELGAIQQLSASQTAVVSMIQERMRQDEDSIYGERRTGK